MANIYDTAEAFRAQVVAREVRAGGELVRAYGAAWQRIRTDLDRLLELIEAERRAGRAVSSGWLFRQGRLEALQRQAEAQIAEFARFTDQRIRTEQAAAIEAATAHAEALTVAGLGEAPAGVSVTFSRLPTSALTDLVGTLQNGSPLRSLLDELGPTASGNVRKALVQGLARGTNPQVIAREIREDLGGDLTRALRIARTETLRSYRTASIRSYQENAQVVGEWIWLASLSERTCAMCWAMHGQIFPVTEPFYSHPNCRCVPSPRPKSWAQLGYPGIPDTRPQVVPGPDAFRRLPVEKQLKILGPGKFTAYQRGELDLSELVREKESRDWGPSRFERSLKDLAA